MMVSYHQLLVFIMWWPPTVHWHCCAKYSPSFIPYNFIYMTECKAVIILEMKTFRIYQNTTEGSAWRIIIWSVSWREKEESNNEVGGNNSTQPWYRLEGHAQRCSCDSRKQGRWSKMLVAAALRTEHGGHVALLGTLPFLQYMSIHNIIKQFSLQFFLPVDTAP